MKIARLSKPPLSKKEKNRRIARFTSLENHEQQILKYTPAGVARILNLDKSLCFACQLAIPTHLVTATKYLTSSKKFTICENCLLALIQEVKLRNKTMRVTRLTIVALPED